MAKELVLEEIGESEFKEVARIPGGEVVVGREPDNGIALGHQAISREHGAFMRMRNHWFYKDLGSTNGSWINDQKVDAEKWYLVRPDDFLQMADVAVRLRLDEGSASSSGIGSFQNKVGRSLIIFSEGSFIDEFPIPEFGRALVVGGGQADLEIRGDLYDNPSLVVEKRGDNICAFNVAKQLDLQCNGETIEETVILKDRDNLDVAEYRVIFSEPPTVAAGVGLTDSGSFQSLEARVKGWGEGDGPDLIPKADIQPGYSRSVPNSGFGRSFEEDDVSYNETISMDPGDMSSMAGGRDIHPSSRYGYGDLDSPGGSSGEDRIIILVAIVLFVILLSLVVWWVMI